MRRAGAIVIGNELLTGKVADQNVAVLARTLRQLGIRLERVLMILDEVEVIAAEVRAQSAAYDVVFTSGGVGPTHDDVTIDGVAAAFDEAVEASTELEDLLRGYYRDKLTDAHLRMARTPASSRLVRSPDMPWPTVVVRNVWVLPGIPQIFAMKMGHVRRELGADVPFVSEAVLSSLEEGELKDALDRVVSAFGDVEIGSYPRWGDHVNKTKLTFDGLSAERVRAARDAFVAGMPAGTTHVVE